MTKNNLDSPILLKYLKKYESNPDSKVFAPLAEAYRNLGMHNKALEVLKKGLDKHPGYATALLCLANCYFDTSKFDLAYHTLFSSVQINKDNIRMQKLFGQACLALDKKKEALDTFKYLLFLNPKDFETAKQVKTLENELGPSLISKDEFEDEESAWVEVDLSLQKKGEGLSYNDIKMVDKSIDNQERDEDFIDHDLLADHIESFNISSVDDSYEDESHDWEIESKQIEEDYSLSEPQEEDHEKPVAADDENYTSPMLTFTLVELYVAQGLYKKAYEIMLKFKEAGHNDERTLTKIDEIKTILFEHNRKNTDALIEEKKDELEEIFNFDDEEVSDILVLTDDEEEINEPLKTNKSLLFESGESDLMKEYDKRIGREEAVGEKETEEVESSEKEKNIQVLDDRFKHFLGLIQEKSNKVKSDIKNA